MAKLISRLFLLVTFLLISTPGYAESGFDVIFLHVGQGECTIVKCDGETLVIDATTRDKGMDVQGALFKLDVDQVKMVVATHPDRDHNDYLDDVIRLYRPKTILLPPIEDKTSNKSYGAVISAAEETGVEKVYPFVGDTFSLGSATITVYGPHSVSFSEEDDWSIVLMIEYQGVRFLFTGDAEMRSEEAMLMYDDMYPLKADVLKVGKHGSDNASSYDFIQAVSPQIASISCGEDNRYDFPNGDVIQNLLDAGVEDIRVTWKNGDIHLSVIDGQLFTIP